MGVEQRDQSLSLQREHPWPLCLKGGSRNDLVLSFPYSGAQPGIDIKIYGKNGLC